jgi:hypothetical protein
VSPEGPSKKHRFEAEMREAVDTYEAWFQGAIIDPRNQQSFEKLILTVLATEGGDHETNPDRSRASPFNRRGLRTIGPTNNEGDTRSIGRRYWPTDRRFRPYTKGRRRSTSRINSLATRQGFVRTDTYTGRFGERTSTWSEREVRE